MRKKADVETGRRARSRCVEKRHSAELNFDPADLKFVGVVEPTPATCRSATRRLPNRAPVTAVLSALGHILRAIDDDGDLAALTQLDLSAAFRCR